MSQQALYNFKYRDEVWSPVTLRPDARSTTRNDDVARLLRDERGRLLDLGCGAGQMVIALAEAQPALTELVGVDIADARVALANRVLTERYPHLTTRVRFACAPADRVLPFEDRSFDVVVATVVLEFVEDVFTAVDEMARVCRPGGCTVVTVANVCYVKHVASLLLGRVPRTSSPTREISYWRQHGWDGGCKRYFSKQTLSQLLQSAGFEPERWTGAGSLAKMRRWCANLCGSITVRARRQP
jgi:ubiquinone/menaquinone biosynthesis C-methylase UbiE